MKLIIIFLFTYSIMLGQTPSPSKKDFLETLDYNNLKTWTSCNINGEFFKSEIVYLDDLFNYIDCKEYVTWRFDNLKSFHQFEGKSGNGHGIAITKPMTKNDCYKIKIVEEKTQTILNIYNQKVLIESFIVLSAGYDSSLRRNRLTLKRIK